MVTPGSEGVVADRTPGGLSPDVLGAGLHLFEHRRKKPVECLESAHPRELAPSLADLGRVGCVLVERRYLATAEITFAAVVPEMQGGGVGTQLADSALAALAEDGVAVVEVKTLDASARYEPYVATRGRSLSSIARRMAAAAARLPWPSRRWLGCARTER